MPSEDIKNFFASITGDQAAADELASASDDAQFADKVVALAAGRGVTLKRDEVAAHIAAARKASESSGDAEMSDQQLEEVAGGWIDFSCKGGTICIVTTWNPTNPTGKRY